MSIIAYNINSLAKEIHNQNKRWWYDLWTGKKLDRNFGELIALCHSELSEALEGDRKTLMDDKLPHRTMVEVELADCIIRILDTAYGKGYIDIGGAIEEKLIYNQTREDHQEEARKLYGGKKY